MEKEEKNKQSDVLRKKADSLEAMVMFLAVLLVIFGVIGSVIYAIVAEISGAMVTAAVNVVLSLLAIYVINVTVSSKAAYYRNQAEMLDVLNEIKEQNKNK